MHVHTEKRQEASLSSKYQSAALIIEGDRMRLAQKHAARAKREAARKREEYRDVNPRRRSPWRP